MATLTLGEHTIEIKAFLTGGDWENIQDAMIGSMEIDPKNPTPTLQGSALKKFNQAKIEAAVVSIDGATDGILDRVRGLRSGDYQVVLKEINKLLDESEGKGSESVNS